MRYYIIFGKNNGVPVCYKTRAATIKDAKNHFYLEAGDTITEAYKVSKKSWEIRADAYPLQH